MFSVLLASINKLIASLKLIIYLLKDDIIAIIYTLFKVA
jgi:hypothetical protein